MMNEMGDSRAALALLGQGITLKERLVKTESSLTSTVIWPKLT